jgi:hypothetical protein
LYILDLTFEEVEHSYFDSIVKNCYGKQMGLTCHNGTIWWWL